jgi:hypothetical protein
MYTKIILFFSQSVLTSCKQETVWRTKVVSWRYMFMEELAGPGAPHYIKEMSHLQSRPSFKQNLRWFYLQEQVIIESLQK